jgi:hypothetical protein
MTAEMASAAAASIAWTALPTEMPAAVAAARTTAAAGLESAAGSDGGDTLDINIDMLARDSDDNDGGGGRGGDHNDTGRHAPDSGCGGWNVGDARDRGGGGGDLMVLVGDDNGGYAGSAHESRTWHDGGDGGGGGGVDDDDDIVMRPIGQVLAGDDADGGGTGAGHDGVYNGDDGGDHRGQEGGGEGGVGVGDGSCRTQADKRAHGHSGHHHNRPDSDDAPRSFSSPKQRQAWLRNLQKRKQKQAAKARQPPAS